MLVVSPRTAKSIADKYAALPKVVARLEPSEVGQIFKHAASPCTYFPTLGLFCAEFALGYCHNMHYKRTGTGDNK
jgi:hypothetical protein